MKYRVLRFFEGDDSYVLIGHYDLKIQASMAITDDQLNHPKRVKELKYQVEPVEEVMTQAEVDKYMRTYKNNNGRA